MIGPYKADWRIQRKDLLSQRSKGAKDPPRRTCLPFSILIRLKTKKIRCKADLENHSINKVMTRKDLPAEGRREGLPAEGRRKGLIRIGG